MNFALFMINMDLFIWCKKSTKKQVTFMFIGQSNMILWLCYVGWMVLPSVDQKRITLKLTVASLMRDEKMKRNVHHDYRFYYLQYFHLNLYLIKKTTKQSNQIANNSSFFGKIVNCNKLINLSKMNLFATNSSTVSNLQWSSLAFSLFF